MGDDVVGDIVFDGSFLRGRPSDIGKSTEKTCKPGRWKRSVDRAKRRRGSCDAVNAELSGGIEEAMVA